MRRLFIDALMEAGIPEYKARNIYGNFLEKVENKLLSGQPLVFRNILKIYLRKAGARVYWDNLNKRYISKDPRMVLKVVAMRNFKHKLNENS